MATIIVAAWRPPAAPRHGVVTLRAPRRARQPPCRSVTARASPRDGGSDLNPVFGLPPTDLPASVWALKPLWCQPWSILGTGAAVTAGAVSINPWLGGAVGLGVAAWWWLFLVVVPGDYRAYAAAAKERAREGVSTGGGGVGGGAGRVAVSTADSSVTEQQQ